MPDVYCMLGISIIALDIFTILHFMNCVAKSLHSL